VKTRLPILVALLSGLLGFDGEALAGQIPELMSPVTAKIAPPMEVPFGPGEHLTYQLKLGVFSVGEGHMEVIGLDSVRGELTYHTSLRMAGGVPGFRVRYDYQSCSVSRSW